MKADLQQRYNILLLSVSTIPYIRSRRFSCAIPISISRILYPGPGGNREMLLTSEAELALPPVPYSTPASPAVAISPRARNEAAPRRPPTTTLYLDVNNIILPLIILPGPSRPLQKIGQEGITTSWKKNNQDGGPFFFILPIIISKHSVNKPITKLTIMDKTKKVKG
jgi:hypothetical protein